MRGNLLLLGIAFVAFGTACTEITALPTGSEHFDPPAEYALWWRMTESCSGRSGDLSAVEWFVVPRPGPITVDGREYGGLWYQNGNRIVLAFDDQTDGALVRHEMLHALLRENGHPRSQFLGRCAGVVTCAGGCVKDAGAAPVPPDGTPLVAPNALETSVEVQPNSPSASEFGGYFTLTVTAHNDASHAVVALLPPSGDAGPSGSFSYTVGQGSSYIRYDDRAYDSGVTFFAAGETKRDVFDLHVGSDAEFGGLLPGTYTAAGSYGGFGSAPVSFTIVP